MHTCVAMVNMTEINRRAKRDNELCDNVRKTHSRPLNIPLSASRHPSFRRRVLAVLDSSANKPHKK